MLCSVTQSKALFLPSTPSAPGSIVPELPMTELGRATARFERCTISSVSGMTQSTGRNRVRT